ncbi:MAG: T9SS type A sorting domain-containing protein, partial [Bacteroidota bacterium]
VSDKSSPIAVCRDLRLSTLNIYQNGIAQVPVATFDDGSYDQCGAIVARLAQRLDNKFTCQGSPLTFVGQDFIEFCCEDIGRVIPVRLTLIDASGNRETCEVNVHVGESAPFEIVNDTIQVSCIEFTHPDTLGFPVLNERVCYDPKLSWTDSLVRTDICSPTIVRTWYDSTTQSRDRQYILINPSMDFSPLHIRWPLHYNGRTKQSIEGHEVVLPDPISCDSIPRDSIQINPETCQLIGITYYNERSSTTNAGCFGIARYWNVIDWCTYRPNSKILRDPEVVLAKDSVTQEPFYRYASEPLLDGYYTFVQQIRFEDFVPPVIDRCEDVEFVSSSTCAVRGVVSIDASDHGSCSSEQLQYWYEIRMDGILIEADGLLLSQDQNAVIDRTWTVGEAEILWSVNDLCGGVTTCLQHVTILPNTSSQDICIASVVTSFDTDGSALLWIEDVLIPKEGCTELDYFFSQSDTVQEYFEIGCTHIDEGGKVPYEVIGIYADDTVRICSGIVSLTNAEAACRSSWSGSESRSVSFETDIMSVSPNPFVHQTDVIIPKQFQNNETTVTVQALNGQIVFAKQLEGQANVRLTEDMLGSAGVYIVRITYQSESQSQRVIKL